jgi:vitamin K-dependent gamma-carboxylase
VVFGAPGFVNERINAVFDFGYSVLDPERRKPKTENRIMNFLFRKVNIASLVFFRIVFGVLGFVDVLGSWIGKHFIDKTFVPGQFQFKYYGFEWVKTLSDPWLSMVFIITMVASLGIAVGKWYRVSATVFALGFSYIFFLEKAYYLNHGYLTMLIAWWIIFMPLARNYSLDVLKRPDIRKTQVPYWSLFLLQFMMGLVYFFGGIAKLNKDWINGMPLKIWLKQKSDMPILGYLWEQEWVAYAMSYSGLLLDLLVVFFLINKRTRIWALGFVVFFHLNNLILFQIGIFPFLSVTLTLLYFKSDFPIRVWNWLEGRFGFLVGIGDWWRRLFSRQSVLGSQQSTVGSRQYFGFAQHKPDSMDFINSSTPKKILIRSAILVFGLVMFLVPLRHHLFKGNVAWTEEGHRYSWRMMLRQKQAYGDFTVKNLKTNTTEKVKPRDYLTKRQKRKMLTHPDMILQFAHFLRDKKEKEYDAEVAVFAHINSKVNGRKYQHFVDQEVDLAKEEWRFFERVGWIVPLEE